MSLHSQLGMSRNLLNPHRFICLCVLHRLELLRDEKGPFHVGLDAVPVIVVCVLVFILSTVLFWTFL